MATINEIKELAINAARGTAPANYSAEVVDEALRGELKAMCSSIMDFNAHKYEIFTIIAAAADTVAPQRVIDRMGMFAEFQQRGFGEKIVYHLKKGKGRAKQFITRVGLSGVYESFRLDTTEIEVPVHAVGSAISIDFQRLLDGSDNMADLMEVVVDGLEDAAYLEVAKCLMASLNNTKRPTANQYIDNGFVPANLQKLCTTVKRYGDACAIFACDEFIDKMGPDAIVPAISGAAQGIYSPDDIQAIHDMGRIRIFRGTPIVELPQSWTDESNTKTWLNPQFAYVMPVGKEKVVKFGWEGGLQMWDFQNADRSMEIQFYQMMGAAIITYNNWGLYQNTAITDSSENPYGF